MSNFPKKLYVVRVDDGGDVLFIAHDVLHYDCDGEVIGIYTLTGTGEAVVEVLEKEIVEEEEEGLPF